MDASDPCRWAAPLAGVHGRAALARAGERAAADHLVRTHGLVTVAMNVRVAVEDLRGELDVIAEDRSRGLVVVCEVKARSRVPAARPSGAGAVEALGAHQRARIRRMTAVLLADGTFRARTVRFDLVTVDAADDHDGRVALPPPRGCLVSGPRLTIVHTLALVGVEARPVRVECAVSGGLPGLRLVGLPDTAVREAGERVRAALQRSGFRWPPLRIVVNLAPADLPKVGTGFDLPLALGILAASGQVDARGLAELLVHGEVGLDGTLRGVPGVLAVAIGAQRLGSRRLLTPEDGSEVTASVAGLTVLPARDLAEAAAIVEGRAVPRPVRALPSSARPPACPEEAGGDLLDVRGQPLARRAVEVAAAGGHHLLLVGPPGCGKSMLARRLVSVLPDLDLTAQLEVATIHGVAGGPCAVPSPRPPVRAPQAGLTAAALVGGGAGLGRPGELSLAHRGVLILDELLETSRAVLDALRQPLEEGRVVIDRARVRVTLPARVQLVATTNPCPCGMLGHPRRACTCRHDHIERYRSRLSGPLLDRVDVHVTMRPVPRDRLIGPPDGEPSATVAHRVRDAQAAARARQDGVLSRDAPWSIVHGSASVRARRLLADGLEALGASARSHDRCLRVARTIADLADAATVEEDHVAEALGMRLVGLPS